MQWHQGYQISESSSLVFDTSTLSHCFLKGLCSGPRLETETGEILLELVYCTRELVVYEITIAIDKCVNAPTLKTPA